MSLMPAIRLSVLLVACLVCAPAAAQGNVNLPRYPSISPDGLQIVFSWRGDLWKASSGGGQAQRLTIHRGDDLRSAWSPDGSLIAFDSDRSGYSNLYIMNADGTGLRQVTDIDRPCALEGFGVDEEGKPVLTFTSSLEADLYRSPRPYMVSVEGGELRRVHGAFGSEAHVSSDGRHVLFTRGGSSWDRRHYRGPDHRDVWTFTRGAEPDKAFTRLTTWTGNDGKAQWVDGDTMLFLSDRSANTINLYMADAGKADSGVQQLTSFTDNDIYDFDVASGGSKVVLLKWDALYTYDLRDRGNAPVALSITANEDEADNFTLRSVSRDVSEAALSPDGKTIAVVAYGEIYVRALEDKSPTRRVTWSHARERDIAWSPDGLKLYFASDSDGTLSIYAAAVELTRKEVHEQFDEATSPPPPVEEAPADEAPAEPAAEPKPEPVGDAAEPEPTDPPAPAPGGEPAEKPADEKSDEAEEEKKEEKPDPKLDPKRWQDAMTFTIAPVVAEPTNDRAPSPSPDGKHLAFLRSMGNIMVMNLETGETRALSESWDVGSRWEWSPNSRWIAYEVSDLDFNSDIWIVPADGSTPAVNVTRHPDNESAPRWSADCRVLAFLSERVNEEVDVFTVYLDRSLEGKSALEMDEYYKNAAEAAKKRKPLEVKGAKPEKKDAKKGKGGGENGDKEKDEDKDKKPDKYSKPAEALDLDDAYLRVRRITNLAGNEGDLLLTPGGETVIFSATIAGTGELNSIKWDGSERKRIGGRANVQHLNLAGDQIVLVSSGAAAIGKVAGGEVKTYDINDRMRIDLQEQASQKFIEAARILGEQFYHPTMKDTDWPALTQKYHALARQSRTASEFNFIAAKLIGELNASHLGIATRDEPSPNRQACGRLGTIHHREGDGFRVTAIVPDSPAAKSITPLKVNDLIIAIDNQPFEPADTVESRLTGRVDLETLVTVRRTGDDGAAKELRCLITPIAYASESELKYAAWQRRMAALAGELSGGKIGYIHIAGMDQGSLDEFERDLYAAAEGRKGLIIDVRNNGGGWTADRLLSSIMVREHAYTIPRGGDRNARGHYPQDRLFIQRYTLPINMLCNEKSFSNAEIISHAFKTLKRGTLVGQQTYGGVISTGGTSLIDGTFVRLPFRGWFLPDGTDMENNGATPDLLVPQTPQAESRDEDEQFKAAVMDLMKRL